MYLNGKWCIFKFDNGLFHDWGVNYEEFESGAGNYSVGIIELPDGKIILPPASNIQFLDIPNEDEYGDDEGYVSV